jgi:hypothetical protein
LSAGTEDQDSEGEHADVIWSVTLLDAAGHEVTFADF